MKDTVLHVLISPARNIAVTLNSPYRSMSTHIRDECATLSKAEELPGKCIQRLANMVRRSPIGTKKSDHFPNITGMRNYWFGV